MTINYCSPDGSSYCSGNTHTNTLPDYSDVNLNTSAVPATHIRRSFDTFFETHLLKPTFMSPENFTYLDGKSEVVDILTPSGNGYRRLRVKNIYDLGNYNNPVSEGGIISTATTTYFRILDPESVGTFSATKVMQVMDVDYVNNIIEFDEITTSAAGVGLDTFTPKIGHVVAICSSATGTGNIRGPKDRPDTSTNWAIKGGTYKSPMNLSNMTEQSYFLIGYGHATFPLNRTQIEPHRSTSYPMLTMFNITIDGNIKGYDPITSSEYTTWGNAWIGSTYRHTSSNQTLQKSLTIKLSMYNCTFIGPSISTLTSLGVAADYTKAIHFFAFGEPNMKYCKFIDWIPALRDHMLEFSVGSGTGEQLLGTALGWKTNMAQLEPSRKSYRWTGTTFPSESYGAQALFHPYISGTLTTYSDTLNMDLNVMNSNPEYAIKNCTFVNSPIPQWYIMRDCVFVNCRAVSNTTGDNELHLAEIGESSYTLGSEPYRFIKNNIVAYTNGDDSTVEVASGVTVAGATPDITTYLEANGLWHSNNNEIKFEIKTAPYFAYEDVGVYGLATGDLAKGYVPNYDEGYVDDAGATNEIEIMYTDTHSTIGNFTFDNTANSIFVLRDGGGSGDASHPYLKYDSTSKTWKFKQPIELDMTYPAGMVASAGTVSLSANITALGASDLSVGDVLILPTTQLEQETTPANIGEYVRVAAITLGTGVVSVLRYIGVCPTVDPDVRKQAEYATFYGARVQTAGAHTVTRHIQHTKLVTKLITRTEAVSYLDTLALFSDGNTIGNLVKSAVMGELESTSISAVGYQTGTVNLKDTSVVARPGDVLQFGMHTVATDPFQVDDYGVVLSNSNNHNDALTMVRGIRNAEADGSAIADLVTGEKKVRTVTLASGHDGVGISPNVKMFWATEGSSLTSYAPILATDSDDIAFLQGFPDANYTAVKDNMITVGYDAFMNSEQLGYSKFHTGVFMGVFPVDAKIKIPIAYKSMMLELDFFYNK